MYHIGKGTGMLLGPIICGAFTSSSAGWRWGFYLNICIAALYVPVYLFILPGLQPRPEASFLERTVESDIIGTVLLTGAYLATLMAIQFGGVIYMWNNGCIIALFVVGGFLLAAFYIQQYLSVGTTPSRRAFPLEFFRRKYLSIIFLLESCASSLLFIPVYFIPLYFQFVRQDSAIMAGVRLIPLIVFMIVAIVLNGIVVTVNGRYKPWFVVGSLLGLIGSALLYTVDISTTSAKIYGYSILIGAGSGCFLQLPFSVAQSLVPPAAIPKAIGFITFAQLSAPSFVLAIINAVFLNEAAGEITRNVAGIARKSVISILSGVGSEYFNQLDILSQRIVLNAIVKGLSKRYIVAIVSGGLAFLLSLFLSSGKMYENISED
jgi:hypothetical protein